jgi:hypothetical protein
MLLGFAGGSLFSTLWPVGGEDLFAQMTCAVCVTIVVGFLASSGDQSRR